MPRPLPVPVYPASTPPRLLSRPASPASQRRVCLSRYPPTQKPSRQQTRSALYTSRDSCHDRYVATAALCIPAERRGGTRDGTVAALSPVLIAPVSAVLALCATVRARPGPFRPVKTDPSWRLF